MRITSAVLLATCAMGSACGISNAIARSHDSSQQRLDTGAGDNGRALVEANCIRCHAEERLATPGYTRDGWQDVVSKMIKLGATVGPSDVPALTDYLATTFPPKPQAAAVLPGGNVHVSFREWAVQTPGAFPHDPLATPDGAIWYTGQHSSLLGRIDSKTGAIKEYPTAIPDSGPHGLTADSEGNIWFTANYAGYVGKLDPKSGSITAFKMPDAQARDPHTPVFDQRGMLWFTVQAGNMIGRIDPRTAQVKLTRVPTPHALPYGIVVNSRGVPFFAEFGTNKIGSVDPNTLAIHEYVLSASGARPRRIAVTRDDAIWYTDYARGFLGRLDPNTGTNREWKSPAGADARPYGITALNGSSLWYSESGVTPNTLVRFDPAVEKFQAWPIPAGGGVVRNMMPTTDGRLVLAESGVGKVAAVDIH